jgi:hypothetical protein
MTEIIKDYALVGWTDSAATVKNIPILKNATQFISHHAGLSNWQLKSIPISKNISRFTILRDPFERWLTAFTEDVKVFIHSRENPAEVVYLKNLFETSDISWFLDFLIDHDVVYFDTHAQLQSKQLELALDTLGKNNITFIKLNDKLGYFLNHWLHSEGCANSFNNTKINARDKKNDPIYKKIQTYFFDGRNLKRKEKVFAYLQPDYELFNTVNFINPA